MGSGKASQKTRCFHGDQKTGSELTNEKGGIACQAEEQKGRKPGNKRLGMAEEWVSRTVGGPEGGDAREAVEAVSTAIAVHTKGTQEDEWGGTRGR